MAFSKSAILTAKGLARLIKEATANGEQRFCFILGSGASVESGIPSGNTLEMQWMDCLMGKSGDRGMPAMDADETRRLGGELFEEKEIKHPFEEIEAAWSRAKNEGKSISSEFYFDIYRLRFHANPRKGYGYLEKIMENRDPSLGYHTLARLLTENNQNNLVITTNFDSLVEDSLFLYTDKRPLVVSHESLVNYMDANVQRPIVAKVHRGLMYAPFNSPETTNELAEEWQTALDHALNTYTPIVIGYAGGDHSLMSFLEDEHTVMRKGVYWCYRGKRDPDDLPEKKIQDFVEKCHGFFVAIDGFDALMVEIGKVMYGDAIRPGLTADHLKKMYDKRVQLYNQQWDKLNEKPEFQEALEEMNKAERLDEEKREEEKALTAWDYIRRGNRAYDEGRFQDAINEYTKAVEMEPENAAAYNNRGNTYRVLKNPEEALKDYNKAIELDPDYAHAYNNRGNAYDDLGNIEEAIRDFNKAIELDPNYPVAYYNRGNEYYKLERSEEALKDYNKAIELDPDYGHAYNNRGNRYHDLGRSEEAVKDYNKAIELDPDNAYAYNNRGVEYKILHRYAEAIEDFTRAIQLNPEYKTAYSNRAEAYSAIGEEALAEADRKRAEEL